MMGWLTAILVKAGIISGGEVHQLNEDECAQTLYNAVKV